MAINTLKILSVILLLLALPISQARAGKIYKWVDENGVTQFSTYPPLVLKDSQPVTTVQGLSTGGGSTDINEDSLQGVWFVIDRGKKHTMTFHKATFVYRPQESATGWGLASSGTWKLDGGIIEFTYNTHEDKNKRGTKEEFFVKQADEFSLTLISREGNKRFNFRKDTDILKADKAVSRVAQELMGYWTGLGGGDSIYFSNEVFELKGKRKEDGGSVKSYEAFGTKYKGRWHVDDPYINLEVTLDEVYKFEDSHSQVGRQWQWVIVKRTADLLTVRDTISRRLLKFAKTSK